MEDTQQALHSALSISLKSADLVEIQEVSTSSEKVTTHIGVDEDKHPEIASLVTGTPMMAADDPFTRAAEEVYKNSKHRFKGGK